MDQMAHPPTQMALVLPENEGAVERAWTRGLSVALKGAVRAIHERNICMTRPDATQLHFTC